MALMFFFSDFEVASKSIKECIPTKFKEVLKCRISGRAVRRYNFLEFESVKQINSRNMTKLNY